LVQLLIEVCVALSDQYYCPFEDFVRKLKSCHIKIR
jgi:hypothetical protein